jgi:hypothetical protein
MLFKVKKSRLPKPNDSFWKMCLDICLFALSADATVYLEVVCVWYNIEMNFKWFRYESVEYNDLA